MLSHKDYYQVIEKTPLTSVDIYFVYKKSIWLGWRANNPGKDHWFTPGCRGYKNEPIKELIKRVAYTECGLTIDPDDCNLIDVYDHIYENNFKDDTFGTHYVNAAYFYKVSDGQVLRMRCDQQHSYFTWMECEEALADEKVHPFVKKTIKDLVKIL